MVIEKKVETLEGEVKLMKGELKETLTNVRDFLLNLKLPPPTIEGLDLGDVSHMGVDGGLSMNPGSSSPPKPAKETGEIVREKAAAQPAQPDSPAVSRAAEAKTPAQFLEVEASPEPEALELSEEGDEEEPIEESEVVTLPEIKSEEKVVGSVTGPVTDSASQVNLLSNLLRWVSVAAREIGREQLPTFLDVYGTTGNMPPELRTVILRFAGIVDQGPLDSQTVGDWGQLMNEQLATFLEVHSVNGHLSPEVKDSIMRITSVMAEQSSDAHTSGVWNQLMGEKLATFLEVHSANGQLSPEVKEGVLRFIGAMAPQPAEKSEAEAVPESAKRDIADVWSQLILELHGILSGGGTLLHPLKPLQEGSEEEAGADKSKAEREDIEKPVKLEKDEPLKPGKDKSKRQQEDKPVTLKLVLPASNGVAKEFSVEKFSINLAPEADADVSLEHSTSV